MVIRYLRNVQFYFFYSHSKHLLNQYIFFILSKCFSFFPKQKIIDEYCRDNFNVLNNRISKRNIFFEFLFSRIKNAAPQRSVTKYNAFINVCVERKKGNIQGRIEIVRMKLQ